MDRYKLQRNASNDPPDQYNGYFHIAMSYNYGSGPGDYDHIVNIRGDLHYEDGLNVPSQSLRMEQVLSLIKGALVDAGFSVNIGIKPEYTIFDLVEVEDDDES